MELKDAIQSVRKHRDWWVRYVDTAPPGKQAEYAADQDVAAVEFFADMEGASFERTLAGCTLSLAGVSSRPMPTAWAAIGDWLRAAREAVKGRGP